MLFRAWRLCASSAEAGAEEGALLLAGALLRTFPRIIRTGRYFGRGSYFGIPHGYVGLGDLEGAHTGVQVGREARRGGSVPRAPSPSGTLFRAGTLFRTFSKTRGGGVGGDPLPVLVLVLPLPPLRRRRLLFPLQLPFR